MLRNITNRWAAFMAAIACLCVLGQSQVQAQLTVDPTDLYTGVEAGFDAAALIGVAVAAVIWVIRFVKKGLGVA